MSEEKPLFKATVKAEKLSSNVECSESGDFSNEVSCRVTQTFTGSRQINVSEVVPYEVEIFIRQSQFTPEKKKELLSWALELTKLTEQAFTLQGELLEVTDRLNRFSAEMQQSLSGI